MRDYVLGSSLLVSFQASPHPIACGLGHVTCVGQWNVGGCGICFRAEMLDAIAWLGWGPLISVPPTHEKSISWLHLQSGFWNEAELPPAYMRKKQMFD